MTSLQVLFLEDEQHDVLLVKRTLDRHFTDVTLRHARSHPEYLEFLETGHFDIVLSDHSIPGCEGLKAFHIAHGRRPGIPFIYLSGSVDPNRDINGLKALGVGDFVPKSDLSRLPLAIEKVIGEKQDAGPDARLIAGHERLIGIARELSQARDLPAIMRIATRAARELTNADGATFVLPEGAFCHYAEENAIGPLWRGQKFPLHNSLAGWVMSRRQPAILEDVFNDRRTPAAPYAATFARSAVMVPVRAMEPLASIGGYWSTRHVPAQWKVRLLQSLADLTGTAIDNLRVIEDLESRISERKAELESFSHAVSHELRAPLRHVKAFSAILLTDHADDLEDGMRYNLQRLSRATARMSEMIDGLLRMSIAVRTPVRRTMLNLAQLGRDIAGQCDASAPRQVEFVAPDSIPVAGDATLLRVLLQHLLGNAWKFSVAGESPRVELGFSFNADGSRSYFVRDNGAGFDESNAGKLFGVFQRLHAKDEFPGTGIGLATAQRIVRKHDGKIWATGKPGAGATFFFTLGEDAPKT